MGLDVYLGAAFGVDIGEDEEPLKDKLYEILKLERDPIGDDYYLDELVDRFNESIYGIVRPSSGVGPEYTEHTRLLAEMYKKPTFKLIRYGSSDYPSTILALKYRDLGSYYEAHVLDPDEMHPTDDELRFLMHKCEILGITDVEPRLFVVGYLSY